MTSFGYNTGYIEELYAQYTSNPESVSESWREFFADYEPSATFAPEVTTTPRVSREGDGSVVTSA